MQWHDVHELGVQGVAWPDTAHPFDRLPARAEGIVTQSVWDLSRQSAGLCVDFRSNTGAIHARCSLRYPPPVGQEYIKYLDLYCRDSSGKWRWAGVSRFGIAPSGETPLVDSLPVEWREWRVYLPLTYNVNRLEFGVPEGAEVHAVPADTRPPVVIYGTSIVHACWHASRPGMAWPAIVGRRLDWPVINLGFSGSAQMEPPLAEFLAELNPSIFVIDPLANMSLEIVNQNAEPFLRILLQARPKTPLLMMDDRTHAHAWLLPDYAPTQQAKQSAFRALGAKLQAEGYPIHYLQGEDLIGDDSEGTTDGSHPSDLGAMRYADAVTPVLRNILQL